MKLLFVLTLVILGITASQGQKQKQEECSAICPKIYRPVCAFIDGHVQTFSNECMLKYESCRLGKEYVKVKDGGCEE